MLIEVHGFRHSDEAPHKGMVGIYTPPDLRGCRECVYALPDEDWRYLLRLMVQEQESYIGGCIGGCGLTQICRRFRSADVWHVLKQAEKHHAD